MSGAGGAQIGADDPFDTAALRAGVLAAWSSSPTRFREDVNTEDDLRRGGYADTWVAELLQNASDAAVAAGATGAAAGVRGRVRAEARDGELRVANTGAPLDAAGVAALAALRASAKRDVGGATGRFGVGFAAVLAVCSAPRLVTAAGAVAFSAERTAAEVAALGGAAADELARDPRVPALRLVWPADEEPPPDGYATEVRLLPDGPATAPDLLAELVRTCGDLLLALPALERVETGGTGLLPTETRTELTRTELPGGRVRITGPDAPREFLVVARGPVRWALPLSAGASGAAPHPDPDAGPGAGAGPGSGDEPADGVRPAPYGADAGEVLHAPTASAEALSLPARLLAPFPVDPDRRRIRADDPAADALVEQAASAYVELVRAVPPEHRTGLVPEPGFPRSPLDGRLRDAIATELARTPWLPAAAGADPGGDPGAGASPGAPSGLPLRRGCPSGHEAGAGPPTAPGTEPGTETPTELAPDRAESLDLGGDGADGLPELLAAADPAFGRLVGSGVVPPAGLAVERVGPSELARRLTGVSAPPPWWRELYTLLAPAVDTVPGLAAELGALPVPLADGRLAPGPAGVLLPDADTPPIPELRIADRDAVHPLLRRLGAADADRDALLAAPALHELVARSLDDAEAGLDTAPLAEAVLALLDTPSAERADWAGALALTDDEGHPARADELVLPDAAVAPLLDPEAPVGVLGDEWLEYGRDALVAAGVLDRFAVVPFDPEVLHDAEAYDGDEGPAVRDLDLVADDAWPAALALLAGDRGTRAAMLTGYTAWWLARNARIGGRLPSTWRLRSASALAGLYDPVPELDGGLDADETVLAAIGVRAAPAAGDADEAAELLDRLGDPDRTVTGEVAGAAHTALAAAVAAGELDLDDLDPPDRVRTLTGAVVPVGRAVVLDEPWVLPALGESPAVPGGDDPATLADLLDLPLASDRLAGTVRGTGSPVPWADLPEVVLACRALGVPVPDGDLVVHDRLVVDLGSGSPVAVPTWPGADGGWHASDPVRALVAALAATARATMIP
ncbi:sacsin N-terminal ATP-binding-like domain-containing protein [Pseudonocardia nantongensis]|uniref:sacsin N-terminal ATP-binding-like domain-containing protein n=1 Tax=Pseudonocardia nantongensis TaxID=1181885 RepID=UPI00397BEB13